MDPLTTFSLVCGVIQVVDFSTKTLLKCNELYHQGSLSEYQELEDLTNHLVDVRDKLELTTVKQNSGNLGAAEDRSLLEVAGQCSKTAEDLVERFRSLKIEGPRKKRQAVLKTVKLLLEKGELRETQRRLDGYRNVLDTQILINLRFVCFESPPSDLWHLKLTCPDRHENRQRLNLVSLQHSKEYQKFDQRIQNLINTVSQEPKGFEELRDLILNENKEIKESISSEFRDHERRRAEQEQHPRLLESLWFAEILVREETIAEAHKKTFQWIFDRSGRAVRPWSNFNSWLENGEEIYWISGKAGSGKSTLMNFLCQDERTKKALEIWSGSKDVLTARFFFWSAGTVMQKNFDGFLRSLLWQILSEVPDINIFQTSIKPSSEEKRKKASYSQGSIGVWTKRRMLETLHEVIKKLQSSCYLCFFIDGLDEFDDDTDDLIEFIKSMVLNTGVKVCLSSRPDKEFEVAFGSSARLRLQDLTKEDIRQFVDGTFQKVPQLVSMALENEYEMNQVKEQIVDRAEGVFLWVSLAVKDQIRGLRNDDSPEQLQERLARLPSEIGGVYTRMLDQIEKIYLREASSFLKMALWEPGMSLLPFALAYYQGLEDMLLSADEVSEQKMVSLCRSIRNKLITRCVGFLEIHEPSGRDMEIQTTSDRTHNSGKQLETSSEVDMSASDFQRETRDCFDRENEPRQPLRDPDKRVPASSSNAEILDFEADTTINFIHRTAADFLGNSGPGKAFLDIDSSPAFDHRVQYIKAKLGGLRVMEEYRLRRGFFRAHVDIDQIMRRVASLEDLSQMPQVMLCELIDCTMSNLDRRHPDWSSNSHWCTRWGQLVEIESLGQDVTFTTTSPATKLDNSGATQADPKTFLGFAASHGLSLYVNHVLDCRGKNAGSEDLDGLLCCSVSGDSHISLLYDYRSLTMVPELLRRGANPNARVMGKTIWEAFLGRMARVWETRVVYGVPENSRAKENLALAVIAFIKSGADIGMIWSGTIRFYLGQPSSMPYDYCVFDLQASPLSIIEFIMRNEPQMARISEMCDTRGAVRYSRFTSIEFARYRGLDEGEELRNQFKLSEQESKELFETLELGTEEVEYAKILARRLSGFHTRLVENRAGASDLSSIDTSDA